MSRYGRVIEAAYVNLLSLHLMTLLSDKSVLKIPVFPDGAKTADIVLSRKTLSLSELEEVFDDAVEFAGYLGMDSRESERALEQAFAKVLETVFDDTDAELTLKILLPAFSEYANNKKQDRRRGSNPV